ncbi:MAG: hypothetical protein EZS28_013961, partial [Streblomastix strix]
NYDNNSVVCAGGGVKAISDIVSTVDLTDYYNKTKTDELLGDKENVGDLDNYITLDTAQSINSNKTINNACRFTSTIDGMSTITGQSFVKLGADNTVVLLGAGGTKPINEFTTTIDDSNYEKKDGNIQDIQGILRKTTLDQPYPEPTDDDYITLNAIKAEFVSSIYSGSINGNLTANQFIKSVGTDQQVLLANGSTKAISEFGSGSVDDSNYVKKMGQEIQVINGKLKKAIDDSQEEEEDSEDEYYLTKGETKGYFVTLNTQQTINESITFTGNVTANQFVKSGGTNQQELLANGDVKPLLEFGSGSVDDSNFVKKTGQVTQSIEGKQIRSGSMESFIGANISEYMTKDQIVGGCVLTNGGGNVSGNKEASGNITSASFVKSGGTNQQVLLANGNVKPLSEFSGGGGDMSNYVKKTGADVQVINVILRKGKDEEEESEDDDDYITRGKYNNKTNNIMNNFCIRKAGLNTQSVKGRLLYINPFGIEDDDSLLLTDTTYPT